MFAAGQTQIRLLIFRACLWQLLGLIVLICLDRAFCLIPDSYPDAHRPQVTPGFSLSIIQEQVKDRCNLTTGWLDNAWSSSPLHREQSIQER